MSEFFPEGYLIDTIDNKIATITSWTLTITKKF